MCNLRPSLKGILSVVALLACCGALYRAVMVAMNSTLSSKVWFEFHSLSTKLKIEIICIMLLFNTTFDLSLNTQL